MKYVLALVASVSLIAVYVLSFSFPGLSDPLLGVYLLCLFGLFVLFLIALFRRRWREVGILTIICAVVLFPFYGSPAPFQWVYVQAFRLHASPIDEYLSRCKMFEFVERGTKQMLGRCDRLAAGGETSLDVFYDTSGEFVLPIAQRTPEWNAAMSHFSPRAVLLEKEGRARRLFGNFYEIHFSSNEGDGDDERR